MKPAAFHIGDIVAVIRDNGRVHFLITEILETERKYGFTVLQSSGVLGTWKAGENRSLQCAAIDNIAVKVA